MSRGWVPWSLLGVWLAAVVLVVPAGAEEFSLSRCLATGSGSDSVRPSHPQGLDITRHFNCYEAQREYEIRRQAQEAAERERQRRGAEVETRRQAEAQAKETAAQAAKEKSRARQEAERARKAEEVERARQAKEVDAARRTEAREETERARRAALQQPGADQFMPGTCPTPDLTAKCAMPMPQDPVLEQIRKSQENAARGRPSR
jgi:hypothetical protein